MQSRNAGAKSVTMSSREAVQMAEDSRAIAVKRQEGIIRSGGRPAEPLGCAIVVQIEVHAAGSIS